MSLVPWSGATVDPDADPLVRGTDMRIHIQTKCHGSRTQLEKKPFFFTYCRSKRITKILFLFVALNPKWVSAKKRFCILNQRLGKNCSHFLRTSSLHYWNREKTRFLISINSINFCFLKNGKINTFLKTKWSKREEPLKIFEKDLFKNYSNVFIAIPNYVKKILFPELMHPTV